MSKDSLERDTKESEEGSNINGSKETVSRGEKIGLDVQEDEETAKDTRVVSLQNKRHWADAFYAKCTGLRALKKQFIASRPPKMHSSITELNQAKCRYAEIQCTESTRVILKQRSTFEDFIHANWMIMPDGMKYIATQGPIGIHDDATASTVGHHENSGTVDTREDFWHMVFMENVENIVMLCQYYEGTPLMRKCGEYIPKRHMRHFGNYSIYRRPETETLFDGVIHTVFEVKHKSGQSLLVNHYQVLQWPDHEAPHDHIPILRLHRLLKSKGPTHPIVVHGSAGIGRTGTLIGLDYCSQRIALDPKLDMLSLVQEMRLLRSRCVQTHEQFLFLIFCVTELFIEDGVPRVYNMHRLPDYFKKKEEQKKAKKVEK